MRTILHIYSYLFHFLLAVFLVGVALVAWLSGTPNFNLDMLPGSGVKLIHYLLYCNLAGLAAVILAITGRLRFLYAIYGIAVFVLTVRGVFFSSYTYDGIDAFKQALWFTLAASVAMLGSLSQVRARKGRR
ncbi:MAG: hypothetical protein JJE04_13435 [Acidobacteriia bacterium]|nr:hypothetical protein [Terriglobia bacterium]